MRSELMSRALPKVRPPAAPEGPSGVSEKLSGNRTPRSVKRLLRISMTSSSSSTSGSLLSYSAISRSASSMLSGDSRSASMFVRSSTYGSRMRSIARRNAAAPLASALAR